MGNRDRVEAGQGFTDNVTEISAANASRRHRLPRRIAKQSLGVFILPNHSFPVRTASPESAINFEVGAGNLVAALEQTYSNEASHLAEQLTHRAEIGDTIPDLIAQARHYAKHVDERFDTFMGSGHPSMPYNDVS